MRSRMKMIIRARALAGMGMLSTSNYRARKYGVRAAMPGFIAKKLCPELVIVPGNMEKYAKVSEVVRGVFREYDPNFAPMSLDEAYLDLTDILAEQRAEDSSVTAWSLVSEMRSKIEERTQLTASAGIAPNCFLSKVCSDLNKPNGQYQLASEVAAISEFVSKLNIRKVGGIGNVQEQLLRGIGVETCGDLFKRRAEIRVLFSETSSEFYLAVSQGIGSTRIEPPEERERKSISTESTFSEKSERRELLDILAQLCKDLSSDCKKKKIYGQSVTVKIKSHHFKIKTKVAQMCDFSNDEDIIFATAKKLLINLLDSSEEQPLALRLMGVRLSVLKDQEENSSSKRKQKNLLGYLLEAEADNKGPRYPCPVCAEEFGLLSKLYAHVDICLPEGQAGTNSLDKPSCGGDQSKSVPRKVEENDGSTSKDVKVSLEESSVSVCPKSEMMTSSNFVMTRDVGVVRVPEAEASPGDLVCPVCNSRKYKDETSLSSHVEECLNRQTIAELLRTDNHSEGRTAGQSRRTLPGPAPSKKRKSSQSEKKTLKKSRSEFTKPIDSYFKLKS